MTTTQTLPQVAPDTQDGEQVIGIRCLACDIYVTREEWEASTGEIRCKGCGVEVSWIDGTVTIDSELSVATEDADLYHTDDDSEVKGRLWFHVTLHDEWLDTNRDTSYYGRKHYPHVGSPLTVRDLYRQQYSQDDTLNVYAVRVKDDAVMKSGAALEDAVRDWEPVMDNAVQDGVTVVRYLNVYENPGAVSLVTDVSALEVVGAEKFTGSDDLMAKIAELRALHG